MIALVSRSLDDDQAEHILTVDLAGKSSIADFLAIASGRSTRHVGAMAENLRERLKAGGVPAVEIEGMPHCDWVLIDAGDVVVHLFRPEVRAFYNLEKMWGLESPLPTPIREIASEPMADENDYEAGDEDPEGEEDEDESDDDSDLPE